MSSNPLDQPEDPFGPSGMAQLFCTCTGELFKWIYTPGTIRAVCPNRDAHGGTELIMGEWPRQGLDTRSAQGPPGWTGEFSAQRDMLPPPGQVIEEGLRYIQERYTGQPYSSGPRLPPGDAIRPPGASGAAWDGEMPDLPTQAHSGAPGAIPPAGDVPPLPRFSAGICNVYLDGGDYDGQITNLMVGADDFAVRGMAGTYRRTDEVKDGRVIYRYST